MPMTTPTFGTPPTIFLKTVAGRKCAVEPPLTVQRLLDVAEDQLNLDRSTLKLFVDGKPVFTPGKKRSNSCELLEVVEVPSHGIIIVVGRPGRCSKIDHPKAGGKHHPSQQQTSSLYPNDMKFHFALGAETERNGSASSPSPPVTAFGSLGPPEFARGRDGLQSMLSVIRGRADDCSRALQDHPTMMSMVEYINRDQMRLREVLRFILYQEPELFVWIQTNTHLFLDIVNGSLRWSDTISSIRFLQAAIDSFRADVVIQGGGSGLTGCVMPRVTGGAQHPSSPEAERAAQLPPRALILDLFNESSSTGVMWSPVESEKNSSSVTHTTTDDTDRSLLEQLLLEPVVHEVEGACRGYEIAKEKLATAAENGTNTEALVSELSARLHDARASLLSGMEGFMTSPPSPDVLNKICTLGKLIWADIENWFVEQNDILNAFTACLAHSLFEAGRELLFAYYGACSDARNKETREQHPIPLSGLEKLPVLDPTVRWITANGAYDLAQELLAYSVHEEVGIVIYNQSHDGFTYAYIVSRGQVRVVSLMKDNEVKYELEELQRLYSLLDQSAGAPKSAKVQNIHKYNWFFLMWKLYDRLVNPLELYLPPPAFTLNASNSEVQHLCFIQPKTPNGVVIPFPSLISRTNFQSCAMQWACFTAYRPWHLILSLEVPWSPTVARSPSVTRVACPVLSQSKRLILPNEAMIRTGLITYVNVDGTHCVSFGREVVSANHFDVSSVTHQSATVGSGLWTCVPWGKWLRDAMGVIRAGMPAHAWVFGGGCVENNGKCNDKSALLVYEDKCSRELAPSERNQHLTKRVVSMSPVVDRRMPYNQSSDLFVSHVVGRESGVGIHRAALIPIFDMRERDATKVYNLFLGKLAEDKNMTAARAYRLALLQSWNEEFRDEPWYSAAVMLVNYGGPMKTLRSLYSTACKAEAGKQSKEALSNSTSPNGAEEALGGPRRRSKAMVAIRSTSNGRYIENYAVDVIYNVVLDSLSVARPKGLAAVLDCMISCLEESRTSLERSVKRRMQGKDISPTITDTSPVTQTVGALRNMSPRVPFVSSIREKVVSARGGQESEVAGEGQDNSTSSASPPPRSHSAERQKRLGER
ncbi:XPC binding domain [Trypanosoma vivax]|uniref:XPC-binding domain-containing protein n=1 Tax=Trypanosoma vivax (strain Y486) TaxID=1055687 RepID=G0U6G6_TRYVY|nr:XPC binding domain [Trypanosoma vivax]CCC51470.1 conserved hypothetical protein [Trypanosoma vivax Y486]